MKNKLAVQVLPLENRHEILLNFGLAAEMAGFDAVILTESWGYDASLLLTELAVKTSQIQLATGVLSVWGRSPATMAMTAATLDHISGGRFMLGLGASSKQLVEGFHDIPFENPYDKNQLSLRQIRALLSGERMPLKHVPEARALKLNVQGVREVPLLLAASAGRSIQIAWELADGWIPFLLPLDHFRAELKKLKSQPEMSLRQQNWQVIPVIPMSVGPNKMLAREAVSWLVAFYINKMGTIYRNTLKRLGYEKEVALVLAASEAAGKPTVPEEAEALLEQLAIYGTKQDVNHGLAAWYEAGATMPCALFGPSETVEELTKKVFDLAEVRSA